MMQTEALSYMCFFRKDFISLRICIDKAPKNGKCIKIFLGVESFFVESNGLVVNLGLI